MDHGPCHGQFSAAFLVDVARHVLLLFWPARRPGEHTERAQHTQSTQSTPRSSSTRWQRQQRTKHSPWTRPPPLVCPSRPASRQDEVCVELRAMFPAVAHQPNIHLRAATSPQAALLRPGGRSQIPDPRSTTGAGCWLWH